ncbi:hypothetical protein VM1G_08936 [Cytospora mali]|uniref:PARP-type domain-containing protein n=1 Tax=Cytospora mali TaxID=578113 RepID=A0A194WB90_CYTMA|nr:hypothetical protein VM1G_08936 [Valsa mali]
MPGQYRVEMASTGRAGCIETTCKKQAIKIQKGELRFGAWVEHEGHGSWKWKHWGCISGAQIENLREAIGKGDDEYDFDMIDGYDELGDHPELQSKIRTAMVEGKIADEDFNGDPGYNVLGQKGIRGRAKKTKPEDEEGEEQNGGGASAAGTPAKKPAKKRGRGKKAVADDDDNDNDEEAFEAPPAKKARKSRAKKQVDEEDAGIKNEPEPEPEVEQPKKKGRARKPEPEPEPEPEPVDETVYDEVEPEKAPEPAPRKMAARSRKAAAAGNDSQQVESQDAAPKKRRGRKR